jgi:DeoR family transcriptional regulator of aga operon
MGYTFTMNERARSVLNEVRRTGAIAVQELAERTGASAITIRRALTELQNQGLVVRKHGRAETPGPLLYREHAGLMAEEKRRIGLAAAALIESGDVVAFGPGTTTTAAACSVPPELPVRVVTNAVNIAMELYKRENANVFLTGGELRHGWFSLVGNSAIEAMRSTIVDKAFSGITGIHAEHGLTDEHREESAVTRAMFTQARQRIVLADHTKFGQVSHLRVWPLAEIDIIITDTGATKRMLAPFTALGVKIIRA